MAAFEQAILGINVLTLIFVFITLIYIKKNREFERIEFETSLNALLFGVFFLFIMALINALIYVDKNFHTALASSLPEIETYLSHLVNVMDLALLPLFGVCFLVSVLLARHSLPKEESS